MAPSILDYAIDDSHGPNHPVPVVSVPQDMSLPRYLTVSPVARTVASSTPPNKRPRTGDDATDDIASSKRPRVESANQRVSRGLGDHAFQPLRIPTGPMNVTPQVNGNNIVSIPRAANNEHVNENQNPTKLYIISNTAACDVTKLHAENANLRSENANLHKQVSLFKQLMRNPQRLQSVLQRLDEKRNL